MLASYPHFLRIAASLQWSEAAIDLEPDAEEWPRLPEAHRERIARLVAGFSVGETAVARELAPFAAAALDPDASACFDAQARDEDRHARFFGRYAREVVRTPGRVEPAFLELFEHELPGVALALARGDRSLDEAVAFYHLLLEGMVFAAGQLELLELLDETDSLHGLRCGMELVFRDENWHIGFGARCLQDLGLGSAAAADLAAQAPLALQAWGDAVPPQMAPRIARLHRRRMAAAGLGTAMASR